MHRIAFPAPRDLIVPEPSHTVYDVLDRLETWFLEVRLRANIHWPMSCKAAKVHPAAADRLHAWAESTIKPTERSIHGWVWDRFSPSVSQNVPPGRVHIDDIGNAPSGSLITCLERPELRGASSQLGFPSQFPGHRRLPRHFCTAGDEQPAHTGLRPAIAELVRAEDGWWALAYARSLASRVHFCPWCGLRLMSQDGL